MKAHEQELEISLRLEDAQAEGQACRNLGVSYAALGQFAKGLRLLRHAERVALEGEGWAAVAMARNELGEALSRDGQVRVCLAHSLTALSDWVTDDWLTHSVTDE